MRKKEALAIFVYKKNPRRIQFTLARMLALLLIVLGTVLLGIVVRPIVDVETNTRLVLGQETAAIPIPKAKVVRPNDFPNILANSLVNLSGVDYTNARSWFPQSDFKQTKTTIPTYFLSIPKLRIEKAMASFVNDDLSKSLVHYGGSAVPGKPGNAVVFGHSTLPQLFNPKDYKTIFATLHTLTLGDEVLIEYDNVVYKYIITERKIIDPEDISVLAQEYNDSSLTLITCTPPGTYWKRLVLTARIVKIL